MILEEIYDYYTKYTTVDKWENAKFKYLKKMENDTRGEFGEKFISNILHLDNYFVFEMDTTNNSTHNDGHYDLKVNGKRIEIKTSCCTGSGVWQHEPLYSNDKCDLVIFVDFDYDEFHITVVESSDLPLGKESPLFPRKHATLRKNKDDGYKLDFSKTTIKKLKEFGVCRTYDEMSDYYDIKDFIKEQIK